MALYQWIQVSARLTEQSGVSSKTGRPYTILKQRVAVYSADEPGMPISTFDAPIRDAADKLDHTKKYGFDLTSITNGDFDRPQIGNLTLFVLDEATGLPVDFSAADLDEKSPALSDRASKSAPAKVS